MMQPSITLPSKFGPISLTVNALEAPHHADYAPKRYFQAELGAFRVNGKEYGELRYSFYTQGYKREDGSLILSYVDRRARSVSGGWGATMTDKGWSAVRKEIDTVVTAFITGPGFQAVTEQAQADQRTRVKALAAVYVERLQQHIQEIQALAAQADTHTKPEELEQALDAIWRKYV